MSRGFGLRFVEKTGTVTWPPHPAQPADGAWVEAYYPEAHNGRGLVDWTLDPARARRFATAQEAMACWKQIPDCRPFRPDGKPNRPLTAFTVSCEPLP